MIIHESHGARRVCSARLRLGNLLSLSDDTITQTGQCAMSRSEGIGQRLVNAKTIGALIFGCGVLAVIVGILPGDSPRDRHLLEQDVLPPGSEIERDSSGAIHGLVLRHYRAGEHPAFIGWLSRNSKSLRALRLEESTPDPALVRALGDLTELDALYLRDSGNALTALSEKIRGVRILGLEDLDGYTNDLEQLREIHKLESLLLGFGADDNAEVRLPNIDFLSDLQLTSLTIDSWSQPFAVSDFSGFSGLPRLKSLSLAAACDPRVIQEILVGARVEYLSWTRVGRTDAVAQSSQHRVDRLGDWSALESLNLGVRFFEDGQLVSVEEGMDRIDADPEKYTLQCSDEFGESMHDAQKLWNASFFAVALPATAWEAMGELPSLRALKLWHVGFDDRHVEYLLRNPHLSSLEYYPADISSSIREKLKESISRVTFPEDVREQISSGDKSG